MSSSTPLPPLPARLGRVGCPGEVACFAACAQPLVVALDKAQAAVTVAAAGALGRGRVVAVAHEGYLTHLAGDEVPGRLQLLRHLLHRIAKPTTAQPATESTSGDASPITVGIIGQSAEFLAKLLAKIDDPLLQPAAPPASPSVVIWLGKKGSGDVADATCFASHTPQSPPSNYPDLLHYVAHEGGGVLVSMCPWGFEQVTRKSLATDCAQNHLLRHAGMVFTSATAPDGAPDFVSDPDVAQQLHFATDLLHIQNPRHISIISRAMATFPMAAILASSPEAVVGAPALQLFHQAEQLFSQELLEPFHHAEAGISLDKHPLLSLSAALYNAKWPLLPPAAIQPAIGHEDFPGATAAGGEQQAVTLTVRAQAHEWVGLGYWLQAGTTVDVRLTLPDVENAAAGAASASAFQLRVGCHSDNLAHLPQWKRWPCISHTFPLPHYDQPFTYAHPFGGLLYLVNTTDQVQTAVVHLAGRGLTPAAVFKVADPQTDWLGQSSTAPWCELEGDNIIFTVPTASARAIADPLRLMNYWDAVVTHHCALKGEPIPSRRERVVFDRQISAGYMHSGYPVMCHLDQVTESRDGGPTCIDLDSLLVKGNWGMFHELGHNRQEAVWTFEGTGEVTVNWFSLYTMQQLIGIEPWTHPWLKPHKAKIAEYLKKPNFARWKSDPGLALCMYAQLQKHYGWEAYKATMRRYTSMRQELAGSWPSDNMERMRLFVALFSEAVGQNLSSFFQAWGFPEAAVVGSAEALAGLPDCEMMGNVAADWE